MSLLLRFAYEGDTVIIRGHSHSKSWLKDDKEIKNGLSNGTHLMLYNVTSNDTGSYSSLDKNNHLLYQTTLWTLGKGCYAVSIKTIAINLGIFKQLLRGAECYW